MFFALQSLFAQLSKVHYIPPIAAHGASNSNAIPLDQHIYISTPSNNNVSYSITPVGSSTVSIVSDVVSNSSPNVHNIGSGPSNFAIIGRYILTSKVFNEIKKLKPGQGGEIHITDAIKNLINKNNKFYGNIFKGTYLDCGTLQGYINSGLRINKR